MAPARRVAEFRLAAGEEIKAGDEVKASIFAEKEWVDVVGTSKGKGFQGVVKRHGFARRPRDARLDVPPRARLDRRLGLSRPACSRACEAGGRMGGERVTAKNLQIVKIDAERNLIYVRGAVPGPKSGYLAIRRAKRG